MTEKRSQKKFGTSNMKTFNVSRVRHNLEKDHTLLMVIPALIIIVFASKGLSLYLARTTMLSVADTLNVSCMMTPLMTPITAKPRVSL